MSQQMEFPHGTQRCWSTRVHVLVSCPHCGNVQPAVLIAGQGSHECSLRLETCLRCEAQFYAEARIDVQTQKAPAKSTTGRGR